MPEPAMKKVKRSQQMSLLNTGTSEVPVWSRFGKGVTGQTINYNPQTTTEQYIDEDNATTDVDSYQPSIQTPQTVYAGEPCFEFVNKLRKKRAIGEDARAEILLVDTFSGEEGSYEAEKNIVSIQIDDYGGDAGNALSITYTLNMVGDPVSGTFSTADKTFKPAGED